MLPKRVRLGVLRQDQFIYEEQKILNVALMGNQELWKVMEEKEALLAKAEQEFDADRFSALEETIERLDGYSAESRAAAILEGLGVARRAALRSAVYPIRRFQASCLVGPGVGQ